VSNQIRQGPDFIVITILQEKKDQYRLLLDPLEGQTVKARIRPRTVAAQRVLSVQRH
jgi:hypothetical protein